MIKDIKEAQRLDYWQKPQGKSSLHTYSIKKKKYDIVYNKKILEFIISNSNNKMTTYVRKCESKFCYTLPMKGN